MKLINAIKMIEEREKETKGRKRDATNVSAL